MMLVNLNSALASKSHSHDTGFVFVQTVIFVFFLFGVVGCRWKPLDVEVNVAARSRDFLKLVCLKSLSQSVFLVFVFVVAVVVFKECIYIY